METLKLLELIAWTLIGLFSITIGVAKKQYDLVLFYFLCWITLMFKILVSIITI